MKDKRRKDSEISTVGGTLNAGGLKRITATFYRTEAGNEPIRDC